MRTPLSVVEATNEIGISVAQLRAGSCAGVNCYVRVGRRVLILSQDLTAFLRTKRVPTVPVGTPADTQR
jgi:hypothetical protein